MDPRAGLDRRRKSRPTGIRSPDRLRSESLYRLSYPSLWQMSSTLARCLPGHCHCINTAHVLGHSTYQMTLTVHTQVTCLLVKYKTWECSQYKPDKHTNTGDLFDMSHLPSQWGNGQEANICIHALSTRCGTYLQVTNINQT